jgi:hypothetical protein
MVGTAHPTGLIVRIRVRGLVWSGLAFAGALPGCAIYDPWQVWRYHVDYNTERQCAAQIVFYDHLPPKLVRVRLMQWGYNVGPGAPAAPMMLPADAGPALAPPPAAPNPASPSTIPPAPPADLLERSRPPAFTPNSSEEPEPPTPVGPTATRPPIQRTAHATWIFSGPK